MAAKTLKNQFLDFFLALADIKSIFVNNAPVSVMTGPPSF